MKQYLYCLALVALSLQVVQILCQSYNETFKVKLNSNGQFIDNYGRIRIFHGFNSVQKTFPWYDDQILNVTRLKLYKEWGFNIIRLGTMWTGAEPYENSFNETYLGTLQKIINELNQFGMYSLLDMHQDCLSSKFGNYDGVPLWLIDKFPKPPSIYNFPFPLDPNKKHNWADYYITYSASDAYQNLYKSEIGISSWVKFWIKIVDKFKNQEPIIGYELINEPWIGNFYKNVELLMPGYAGKHNLLPVYDQIVQSIRKLDNDTLIFYEPVTFGAYLPTDGNLGTGFDRVPGGDSQRSKSVLSYHYYCFLLNSLNPSSNYTEWLQKLCDEIMAQSLFKSALTNVKSTGGGLMLTEFGLCTPDNNPKSINTLECIAVLELADEHLQSYTYWDSNFFDYNGNLSPMVVKIFARPYPRALQGQPLSYSFNRTNRVFQLAYKININIKAPTEIFIPVKVHYPKGFTNNTTPAMSTSFDNENFIFSVKPLGQIIQNSTITIIIVPIL